MQRPSNFLPYSQALQSQAAQGQTAQGVGQFLRKNEKMAALIPAAQRILALQKECKLILPAMFRDCAVLRFEAGDLLLSLPHTALAARLKQQMPQLKLALLKRGWQVNSIQMKVQVGNTPQKTEHCKEVFLPETALSSLAALCENLEDTPRNAALKAALGTMVGRHRKRSQTSTR